MRQRYSPSPPTVTCPHCGRRITTFRGKIKPHDTMVSRSPTCKGSGVTIVTMTRK